MHRFGTRSPAQAAPPGRLRGWRCRRQRQGHGPMLHGKLCRNAEPAADSALGQIRFARDRCTGGDGELEMRGTVPSRGRRAARALAHRAVTLNNARVGQRPWGGATLAHADRQGAVKVAAVLMWRDTGQRMRGRRAAHGAAAVTTRGTRHRADRPVDMVRLRQLVRGSFRREALTPQRVKDLMQPLAAEGSYVCRGWWSPTARPAARLPRPIRPR